MKKVIRERKNDIPCCGVGGGGSGAFTSFLTSFLPSFLLPLVVLFESLSPEEEGIIFCGLLKNQLIDARYKKN
jgi:hypothetical protein